MFGKIFSLFFLTIPFLIYGQNISKSDHTEFILFELDILSLNKKHPQLKDYKKVNLNKSSSDIIFNSKPKTLSIELKIEGDKTIILNLSKKELFKPSIKFKNNKGIFEYNDGAIFYQGHIKGNKKSITAVSFLKNEIRILFSSEEGNFRITKIKDEYIYYEDKELKDDNAFECVADHVLENTLKSSTIQTETPQTIAPIYGCLDVYFELDYQLYLDNGSSVVNTTNWLSAVFNEVNLLYSNDSIDILISEVFVWTTLDPFINLNSTTTLLTAFKNHLQTISYTGTLAHFISSRDLGGGVAYVDQLCSNINNCGLSTAVSTSISPFPNYSFTVTEIAHEIGHNIGSFHTHSCVWNGNSTQIDDCGNFYSYINGGSPEPCFSSNNVIYPSNGGTIMSYCHLTPSVGVNFINGFGIQPGNLLRSKIQNVSCPLNNCLIPSCTNLTSPHNGQLNVNSALSLSWNSVSHALGYIISIGTSPNLNDIIDSLDVGLVENYFFGELIYDTTVFVTITPYNHIFNEALSCDIDSFTIGSEPVIPFCTNFTYPLDGDLNLSTNVNLTWDDDSIATSYILCMGTNPSNLNIVDSVNIGKTTNFTISNLQFNTTYFAKLISLNSAGLSLGCDYISFTTEPLPIPECTSLEINTQFLDSLKWKKIDYAFGYIVNIGTSPSTYDILTNYIVYNNSIAIDLLPQNANVYVSIRPFNTAGAANCLEEDYFIECDYLQKIESSYSSSEAFGSDFVTDSNKLFVGAYLNDGICNDCGGVIYYEKIGNKWIEKQLISSPNPQYFEGFGRSVGFFNNFLIIGAPFFSINGGSQIGQTYIYEYINNLWVIDTILQAPTSMFNVSGFGRNVTISDNRVAITNSNFINFYEHNGTSWNHTQEITGSYHIDIDSSSFVNADGWFKFYKLINGNWNLQYNEHITVRDVRIADDKLVMLKSDSFRVYSISNNSLQLDTTIYTNGFNIAVEGNSIAVEDSGFIKLFKNVNNIWTLVKSFGNFSNSVKELSISGNYVFVSTSIVAQGEERIYIYNILNEPCCPQITHPLKNDTVSVNTFISWEPSLNSSGYQVTLNSVNNGFIGTFNVDSSVLFITSFTLPYNSEIEVEILSYNNNSDTAYFCDAFSFFTSDTPNAPICTELFYPSYDNSIYYDYPSLHWKKIDDAKGYKLSVGTNILANNILNNIDVANNKYYLNNLSFDTTIYVKILPYNDGGAAQNCSTDSFYIESTQMCSEMLIDEKKSTTLFKKSYGARVDVFGNWAITQATRLNQSIDSSVLFIYKRDSLEWNLHQTIFTSNDVVIDGEIDKDIMIITVYSQILYYKLIGNNWVLTQRIHSPYVSKISLENDILATQRSNSPITTIYKIVNGYFSLMFEIQNDLSIPLRDVFVYKDLIAIRDENSIKIYTYGNGIVELKQTISLTSLLSNTSFSMNDSLLVAGVIQGKVLIYTKNNNSNFVLNQTIESPIYAGGYYPSFGLTIDLNDNSLFIGEHSQLNSYGYAHYYKRNNNSFGLKKTFNEINTSFNGYYSWDVAQFDNTFIVGRPETVINNETAYIYALNDSMFSCPIIINPLEFGHVNVNSTIEWSPVPNATGYITNIGSTPGGKDIVDNFDIGNANVYYPSTPFPYNTILYVSINPYNDSCVITDCSETIFYTELDSNGSCSAISYPEDNAIDLPINFTISWQGNIYSTHYTLEIDTVLGGSGILNEFSSDTFYTLPFDLEYETKYYVNIKSLNIYENDTLVCNSTCFTTISEIDEKCTHIIEPINNSVNVDTNLVIKWNKNQGSYYLNIGEVSENYYNILNFQYLGCCDDTTYLIQNLPANTNLFASVNRYGDSDTLECDTVFFKTKQRQENSDPSSISELNLSNLIYIHPNPSKRKFYINYSGREPIKKVSIFNNIGKLLFELKNTKEIDLRFFDSSIYFVEFEIGNIRVVKKIVLL